MELLKRDEPNNPPADNYNAYPITTSASFKYRSSIIGKTPNYYSGNDNRKDFEIVVPLKYLSNLGEHQICRWLGEI